MMGYRSGTRWAATVGIVLGLVSITAPRALAQSDSASTDGASAREHVEHALELMGGEEAVRSIDGVAFEMMTQWQRTGFRDVPFTDRPSYERHSDVRDYNLPAWRNTRHFGAQEVTNIVSDSVAVTDFGQGPQPLSVAYVDERQELFTYTPDRLLLALLDAPDLRSLPDSSLGGEEHHVLAATLSSRFPSRVFLHAGTGLPTLLRFRAGHPNDFGLVQWGDMDVQVWYSNWRTFGAVSIPTQWDILRVGAPYKRMTVTSADFEAAIASDSFTISDELRAAYWESDAPRPMHESMPAPQTPETPGSGIIVIARSFGVPTGAVSTGDGWLLLGAGQAPFNFDAGLATLGIEGVESLAGVLVAEARGTSGGVVRAVNDRLPVLVSGGAAPFVQAILRNHGASLETVRVIDDVQTLGVGAERVVLAPLALPDSPKSLLLFKPSLGWLYVPEGTDPLHLRMAQARALDLGWEVKAVGTPRGMWTVPEQPG